MRSISLRMLLLVFLLNPAAARSAEVVISNGVSVAGIPSTVANVFIAGERAASTLTSSCTGDVVAAQVYWASQFGGAPDSTELELAFFAAGSFPVPGPVLLNQGGANAQISGPVLSEGVMNEFRHLDPPTNLVPMKIPVVAGQSIVLALQFLNDNNGLLFAPSVVGMGMAARPA